MSRRRSQFRPCIDLHDGQVKQIVGSTLGREDFRENFVANESPGWFAEMFCRDGLRHGHVIKLGDGNENAAREALSAWPGGLQVGGGITIENSEDWLQAGASHVILTSWLFDGSTLDWERVRLLAKEIGSCKIVIDLSCKRMLDKWMVATNRWQTITDVEVSPSLLERLAPYCDEFLIHSADVEGKCSGIDSDLVRMLKNFESRRVTYAGGVANMEDFVQIDEISEGRIDVTVGSALDLFGGFGLRYADLVSWNRESATSS